MGVIEDATDRVNVIYAGEVVERAPTEALFESPQHPYTKALLQSIPGRTPPDEQLPTIEGEVPTPTGPASICRFAPRCPEAFGACIETHPDHQTVGDGRTAACLLHDDDHPTGTKLDERAGDGLDDLTGDGLDERAVAEAGEHTNFGTVDTGTTDGAPSDIPSAGDDGFDGGGGDEI